MLSANCPTCGGPVPISLASPDAIACPSCGYRGLPAAEIRQQMHAALQVLWQMDAGDRQLTGAQRLNVRSAQSNFGALLVVLLVVTVPLMLFAGSCMLLATPTTGLEPINLLFAAAGLLPLLIGLAAAALALRHVHRRGAALAERCAAVPPEGEGQPARCHVCGGPLWVRPRNGIARCGFCHADNVVSARVLARIGAKRAARVGYLVEEVRAEGRALDRSAATAGFIAAGTIVAAPVLGIVLFVVVAITAELMETGPIPGAQYAWVPVTNAKCVARVVHEGSGEVLRHERYMAGIPMSWSAPADVRRFAAKEMVGRELGFEGSQHGRVNRVYRTALGLSFDLVELDIGGERKSMNLAGACEVPSVRRVVSTNPLWERAKRLRARSGKLSIAADDTVYDLAESGGAPSVAQKVGQTVLDFRWDGDALLVLHATAVPGNGNGLDRYADGKVLHLADGVTTFAPDSEGILVGKTSGLYRRGASGALSVLYGDFSVSVIHTSSEAIYLASTAGEIVELPRASRRARLIGKKYNVTGLTRVGQFLYANAIGVSVFPTTGSASFDVYVANLANGEIETDGKAVYFPVDDVARGGVVSLVAGSKDTTGARHYGIDTHVPKAFTLDAGQVFWVDGSNVVAEPIVP
jgi:hypothetical protein